MALFRKIKLKKTVLIIAVFILIAACTLYKLADRYLIEHVKVENAMETLEPQTGDTVQNSNAAQASGYSAMESSSAAGSDYSADDWNYSSAGKTIKVKKVTEGTGEDTITYYVADVVLKDSSGLKSAFAKNEFGNNIVEYTSQTASDNNAVLAVNGDYYGFRDDGIVIRNGKVFRDVPARTGLAFYKNGSMKIYDERAVTAEELVAQGVTQTFSFGPALVMDSAAITDFGRTTVDTNFGNRSIQGSNPRTGVGIISANHYVFVVVDGRSPGYSKGMTLSEFARLFEDLGCTDAYNLDGGGSSTMYFMGRVVNDPLGRGNERGVSDILYIN